MTDFASEAQILKMVKQEFLKIVQNINESVSWDESDMCGLLCNLINYKRSFCF